MPTPSRVSRHGVGAPACACRDSRSTGASAGTAAGRRPGWGLPSRAAVMSRVGSSGR
jgi:hypothetical protein